MSASEESRREVTVYQKRPMPMRMNASGGSGIGRFARLTAHTSPSLETRLS